MTVEPSRNPSEARRRGVTEEAQCGLLSLNDLPLFRAYYAGQRPMIGVAACREPEREARGQQLYEHSKTISTE